jgi:hypothetical protein
MLNTRHFAGNLVHAAVLPLSVLFPTGHGSLSIWVPKCNMCVFIGPAWYDVFIKCRALTSKGWTYFNLGLPPAMVALDISNYFSSLSSSIYYTVRDDRKESTRAVPNLSACGDFWPRETTARGGDPSRAPVGHSQKGSSVLHYYTSDMYLLLTSLTAVSCQSYAFYTFYHTWIEVSIPTPTHLTHYLINNQETSAMQRLPDLTKILISVATNGLGSCMPSIYPTSCSSGLRSYGRSFQHIPTLPFSAFGKFPLPIILFFFNC